MAYIQPNSTVEFYQDLGIDPSYENTLYFASVSAKDNYFSSLTPLATATALSYSRHDRGFIRVEKPMSTLISAGYMRFKNTSFENKWFYAFVTSVEYINNVTTQVNFELDVLMTWMGAFSLNMCFVERQHSFSDTIGENIVEENLEIGDYIYQSIDRTRLMDSYTIIIGASVDSQGHDVVGGAMVNNIYSGIELHQFGTVAAANDFIDLLTGKAKSDALVAAVMCPSQFIVGGQGSGQNIQVLKNKGNLDGYTPKNKKLFTYPYNYLVVTNGMGNFATYRYEFWMGNADYCTFTLWGVAGLQPEATLFPVSYKKATSQILNQGDKMTLGGFPVCAFNIDQYKAFLAQNQASLISDAVGTVASGVISTVSSAASGAAAGGIAGGVVGALSGVVNLASQIGDRVAMHIDYAKKPPHTVGNTTGNLESSLRVKDFYFLKQCITHEYARIIDDYFTMYGYAQRKVMTPSMNVMTYFTYTKTLGCSIDGPLPADDARKIEAIFDNGIRFWKNHTNIGNYALNNRQA